MQFAKKNPFFLCLLCLIIFLLGGCQKPETPPDTDTAATEQSSVAPGVSGSFEVSLLKVGKADAIILRTSDHCAVIDCGETEDGQELLDYLQKEEIAGLDYLFITHFDKDHVGGFPSIAESISIDTLVVPDYEGSNEEYAAYEEKIKDRHIEPLKLHEKMSFSMDDVTFEVYPPQKESYLESDNDFSLAVCAYHGENSFLFTGDAMADRLSEILEQTGRTSFDFLKVPHHGRWNKNTQKFIETVNPAYAVITCSKKNPAEDKTLAVLEQIGSSIYMTKDGDVLAVSDGKELTIRQ